MSQPYTDANVRALELIQDWAQQIIDRVEAVKLAIHREHELNGEDVHSHGAESCNGERQ